MKSKHLAVIILSSLLIVTVFAGLGGAKQLMDVFVTNTSDNPVPVDIANEDPIPVQVTDALDRWTHTYESSYIESQWLPFNERTYCGYIVTAGYRTITLNFYLHHNNDVKIEVWFAVCGTSDFKIEEFTMTPASRSDYRTYDVQGWLLKVYMTNLGENYPDAVVNCHYYMTT